VNDIHGINVAGWVEAAGVWAIAIVPLWARVKKWLKKRQKKRDADFYETVEGIAQQVVRDAKAVI
jgi:hypothetical protein